MTAQATKMSTVAVVNPVSKSNALRWRFLLGLIVVLTFGRICTNDFVAWDDYITITQNAKFAHTVNWHMVALSWLPHYAERGLWIPVTQTAWAILASIGRITVPDEMGNTLNPAIFHGANLLIHLINVLLVFEILRRIVRQNTAAAFGALLYAIHPLQVEVVAWASGLKDLLAAMFAFIAILNYISFRTRQSNGSYLIAVLAMILAVLSKPSAMVAPALMATIDLLVLRHPLRKTARSTAIFFLIAIACAIWTKLIQPGVGVAHAPLIYRPLVATDSLAFYLFKLFFPRHLAIDYGRTPALVIGHGYLFWTWIFPLILAVLVWALRKKIPLLIPAAVIFVLAVSPTLGLTRFLFQYYSTVADHYLYIAMLGPALALAAIMIRPRLLRYGIVCAIIVLWSILSIRQEGFWNDNLTFYTHVINVNPRSFLAYTSRGYQLMLHGEWGAAQQDLNHAIAINPTDPTTQRDVQQLEMLRKNLAPK